MNFISTRGQETLVKSATAIIKGIADDGGLYVPESFKEIYSKLKNDTNCTYEDLALKIIGEYFDDIDKVELKDAIDKAYKGRFEVIEDRSFLELYHGPTSAFKDAALLFLPQVMKKARAKCNVEDRVVILTATSGDTGKAALEGFSNVDNFNVVVYYPKDGVSQIQERQMVSQIGDNVKVVAIKGNFDNAQSGVKDIFADNSLKEDLKKKGVILSSANSINIGRLIPQIVYYFYGYFQLVNKNKIKEGDKINVVVPTGNFGNILAAYYGKQMGLPIGKLICASNENNVLTDFFKTGVYDRRRELQLTESPSMDILISSNLERLLFEAVGRDGNKINDLMKALKEEGVYNIAENSREFINDFYGDYATTKEVYSCIKNIYENDGYLMDTHTAVAYSVYEKYKEETGDETPVLIASTASPYKFPRSICNALELDIEGKNDFEILEILQNYTGVEVPKNLKNLADAKVLHNHVCDKDKMVNTLIQYLTGEKND